MYPAFHVAEASNAGSSLLTEVLLTGLIGLVGWALVSLVKIYREVGGIGTRLDVMEVYVRQNIRSLNEVVESLRSQDHSLDRLVVGLRERLKAMRETFEVEAAAIRKLARKPADVVHVRLKRLEEDLLRIDERITHVDGRNRFHRQGEGGSSRGNDAAQEFEAGQ